MVFDGGDLQVSAKPQQDRDLLVVTFTGRDHAPPAAAGAGERFLHTNGISALHFISKANHWWQTPEFEPALDAARAYATENGYKDIVTYGSSMGGFGALVASGRLGAARAVVSVPQYSIDPAVVPWEDRWAKDARQINFIPGSHGPYGAGCEIIVLFDPLFDLDRQHVNLIESHAPVRRIPVEFAEHDVSRILSEVGLLRDVTLQSLRGQYDERRFQIRLREARIHSCLVWSGAARQLARRNKPAWAERATRRAFGILMNDVEQLHGEHDRLVASHAEIMTARGETADLLRDLDQWAARKPEGWQEFRMRALAHAAAGQGAQALNFIAKAAAGRAPDRGLLSDLLALFGRFATPDQTRKVAADLEASLLSNTSVARRMAELLASKGQAEAAKAFARKVVERYPGEKARLAKLIDPSATA